MAETAKYPASSALNQVKKDLKKDKLKVPELDEKTKKHLDQMALLELRAELDPYLIDNPLARLGFDIIERGEEVDGRKGGEILSYIVGDYDTAPPYTIFGQMVPSTKLGPNQEHEFLASEQLREQGITSLLPRSEGSTVYFQQGIARTKDGELAFPNKERYTEPRQGLSTLMHELAHLGARVLENRGYKFDTLPEEETMDAMEARSAIKRGVPLAIKDDLKIAEEYPYSMPTALREVDEATMPILKERGVPPQALQGTFKYEPVEPGIMEKLLGIFK